MGMIATLAANVAHALGHDIIGAVAAWPAVALVGSYELLMMIIRVAQAPAAASRLRDDGPSVTDPLGERAAVVFAAELAADRVPSIRAIRAALHFSQPRAQRLRDHLAVAADTQGGRLAP